MRKLLLTLPLLTVLAACGSGGSGSGAGTIQTPDGKRYSLDNSPRGWITAKTDTGTMIGYNQNDSFYGAWQDDSKQFRQLQYQGVAATEIPQSGTATYVGNVVRVDGRLNEIVQAGTSRLEVDFGAKTVQGHLKMDLARDITLHQGRLNGAEFSGQASVLLNNGGRYQGALMGRGATEAVGLVKFDNNSDLDAAFGGKRY